MSINYYCYCWRCAIVYLGGGGGGGGGGVLGGGGD